MNHATETSDLPGQIAELKRSRNALILAHNYQPLEIQHIADVTGDSLGLAVEASRTDAEIIVFCGVHFMAESAKILSPRKKVLLPRREAGCPMADMITADQARALKEAHPGAPLVTYVNSSAAVKAESDICCTSGNVLNVVRSLDAPKVIMAPDRNLARYTQRQIPEKEYVIHDGYCPTHEIIRSDDVQAARQAHPDALLLAHPECRTEVLDLADHVCSTSGMLDYCRTQPAREFLIATEITMLEVLAEANPAKRFHPVLVFASCANMRMTRLVDVRDALLQEKHAIDVDEATSQRAYNALRGMIEIRR